MNLSEAKPDPAEPHDVAAMAFKVRAVPKQARLPRTFPARRALADPDDPVHFSIPTTAELSAWARGHSIGRLLADICHDLGVMPGNTEAGMFDRIETTLRHLAHGDGSAHYFDIKERRRRRVQDGINDAKGGWPYDVWEGRTRALVRDMLGFALGDPLPGPVGLAPAIAPPSR